MKQTQKVLFVIIISLVFSSPLMVFNMARAAGSANMYLMPASGTYGKGDTISVAIHENSGSSSVNAAHVALTYSAKNLTFVSIGSSSAFNINAPSSGGSGSVKIDRGALPAVSSDKVIATVIFKVTDTSGTANIDIASDSAVLSSSDNTNILTSRTGASYTLNGVSSQPTSSAPGSPAKNTSGANGTKTTTSDSAFDISSISVSNISLNSATVSWNTPVASSSEVDYGQGASYVLSAVDGALVTAHSLKLLTDAGEPYHYVIKSVDGAGRTATSIDMSFHSKGVNLVVDVVTPQNQPLKGAVVAFENKLGTTVLEKVSATTDKSGQATLSNLPVGSRSAVNLIITASFHGKVLSSKVQIQPIAKAGETQNARITLQPPGNFTPIIVGGGAGLAILLLLFAAHALKKRARAATELNRHFPKLPGSGTPPAGTRVITPQITPGGSPIGTEQFNNQDPPTGI